MLVCLISPCITARISQNEILMDGNSIIRKILWREIATI